MDSVTHRSIYEEIELQKQVSKIPTRKSEGNGHQDFKKAFQYKALSLEKQTQKWNDIESNKKKNATDQNHKADMNSVNFHSQSKNFYNLISVPNDTSENDSYIFEPNYSLLHDYDETELKPTELSSDNEKSINNTKSDDEENVEGSTSNSERKTTALSSGNGNTNNRISLLNNANTKKISQDDVNKQNLSSNEDTKTNKLSSINAANTKKLTSNDEKKSNERTSYERECKDVKQKLSPHSELETVSCHKDTERFNKPVTVKHYSGSFEVEPLDLSFINQSSEDESSRTEISEHNVQPKCEVSVDNKLGSRFPKLYKKAPSNISEDQQSISCTSDDDDNSRATIQCGTTKLSRDGLKHFKQQEKQWSLTRSLSSTDSSSSAKSKTFSEDRMREIQTHNYILQKKIEAQNTRKPAFKTFRGKQHIASSAINRKRFNQKTEKENALYWDRLQRVKGTMNTVSSKK